MSEVAFFQFLSSHRTPLEGIKKFCKEKVVGGASITGDTLARALGRPMRFIQKADHLESPQFDIAAISFNTPGAPRAYREATRLKGLGKTVLAGGPHPSALPQEALQHFDAVCIGIGDAQFPRMIEDVEGGQLKRQYYGRQGDWVVPFRKMVRGLSLIQLSRGCLKNCHYCIVPVVFPDGVDDKPFDLIACELEWTSSFLSIIDDNFLPKTRWGKQVLALLKETGKRFICQVSPETALDQESIDLLASSGCTLIGVGLESVSNSSLEFLGKTPVKDPGEVIKRIQDADMGCYLNMIFGSDGETPGIFEETLRFLEETRPAVVSPHILTLYPGTALYNYLVGQERLLFKESDFPEAWGFFDSKHVTFAPDPMTSDELKEGFAAFIKELFSLRKTLRRAPLKFLGTALLSSLLKNDW